MCTSVLSSPDDCVDTDVLCLFLGKTVRWIVLDRKYQAIAKLALMKLLEASHL